jgi:hypothetical protein
MRNVVSAGFLGEAFLLTNFSAILYLPTAADIGRQFARNGNLACGPRKLRVRSLDKLDSLTKSITLDFTQVCGMSLFGSMFTVRSYMWFNLSASQGNNEAAKYRDLIAYIMAPEQIAEAQKLTREWKPQSPQGVVRRDHEVASPSIALNQSPASRTGVPMKNDGGIFIVPVDINGIMTLDFAIDSGCF